MLSKDILSLAMRDTMSRSAMERRPRTSVDALAPAAADLKQVAEASDRAYQAAYHFNALATSRLIPEGGLLLDLGCGSGGFLTYLAQRRPDIQIIGIDPSERLVDLGQQIVEERVLTDRVSINHCDFGTFSERIPSRIDMITGVFSLNQILNTEEMLRCLQQISQIRIRCGCAVWLFDFARPKTMHTAEEFSATLMPGLPVLFRRENRNALMSAFTFNELSDALNKVSLGTVHHAQSKGLHIYQAHWLEREDEHKESKKNPWVEGRITTQVLQQFKQISEMFPTVPLPSHLK
jgi:arsenite methyltransferase